MARAALRGGLVAAAQKALPRSTDVTAATACVGEMLAALASHARYAKTHVTDRVAHLVTSASAR
jgi:hypothetical protein